MSMIGTRVVRKEDPELLTGAGAYVADIAMPGALHVVSVRSMIAHGQIVEIETDDAAAMPGVVGVFTAADLGLTPRPPSMPILDQAMTRTLLATDRVRYVGEPVVAVVAESAAAAIDAAELVYVDIEPLDVVIDIDDAVAGEVLLFPDAGTNVCLELPSKQPDDVDPFADCEVVVDLAFVNPRMAPAPIEPRAALARWDASGDGRGARLTQWSSTQFPHRTRDGLAAALDVDPDRVRVITPEVGGGFGAKNGTYPEEVLVAVLARHLDRPVRWAETRTESMTGIAHARAQHYRARLGGDRDGRFRAYRLDVVQDAGAYPAIGAVLPRFGRIMASGVYDLEQVDYRAVSVVTNTTPVGAYRGAGRPEATEAIERIIDVFAAEVGIDPAEVRRRNLLASDRFPHVTPTGADMDTGEYERALDAVIAAADYPALRAEQQRRRADPTAKLLGLGWATYVEITNPVGASEFGSVTIRPDGSALVLTGSSAHGQGHHTAFAQLVADRTGIAFDRIEVRHGDTDEVARGGGTGGSRSLQVGGGAVVQATDLLIEQARDLAADRLEANPADLVLDTTTGRFTVSGSPTVGLDWADLAGQLADPGDTGDAEQILMVETDFQPAGPTFPFGAHLSVVEVDRDTGEVTVLRHVACDDAGVIVNPLIVDGQVHGGLASGIALAVIEAFEHDEDGNPLTSNLMDYAVPSAAEFPSFERLEMETPTDRNPIGAKGIGEAGTIGATPAVHNAVVDAVAHLGVRHIEMPTTAQRVWRAMQAAATRPSSESET